jgi:hypothetical protein
VQFGSENIFSQVVNGVTDRGNIAKVFHCNFESTSKPNSSGMHEKLQHDFYSAYKSYDGAVHVLALMKLLMLSLLIE